MKKLSTGLCALALCLVGVLTAFLLVGCGNSNATTFEICDDESNAVRAFQLLEAKGVISKDAEGDNYPVTADGKLNVSEAKKSWTNKAGTVKVTLVAENLLVTSMGDYDYALLPCNTAYTGKISAEKRAQVEDDPVQVAGKANIIAARENDYNNDANYKKKIDALTNAMLSSEVSSYFNTKYLGAMTCDKSTQIDLRDSKDATENGDNTEIKVCASDVPHAEVLNGCVKALLKKQGYTLTVKILDWTIQNEEVAKKTYDANYFQHVPYLETYNGDVKLFASCKVHYEPLGIYYGKATEWKF